MRGYIEAGLEQHFLAEWAGVPTTSAHDIFGHLRDDRANSLAKRITAIGAALRTLAENHGEFPAARATFRATVANREVASDAPTVTVTIAKTDDGPKWRVTSGPLHPAFAKEWARAQDATTIAADAIAAHAAIAADFAALEDAAVAVEVGLMGAANANLPTNFVLETTLDRGAESLVMAGARFALAWGEGETAASQFIAITTAGDDLAFDFRTKSGLSTARGRREVSADALQSATKYNP